jgi:hypothetical protein
LDKRVEGMLILLNMQYYSLRARGC